MRGRLKMGREATAKSFRHGFITDALEAGVPIATVAELAGHRGTKMIERTYSKLRERKGHLRDAARKVRPGEADAS
jgi:integrase